MTKLAKTIVLLVLVGMTAGCDHVTKHIATNSLKDTPSRSFLADTVRLEYAENTGGMLSLGASLSPGIHTAVFKIGTGLMLLAVAIAAIKLRLAPGSFIGLSLACAGGMSNWIDRITIGRVVDFMNVGFGSLRTGIFNVADIVVFVGVIVFLFSYRKPSPADASHH